MSQYFHCILLYFGSNAALVTVRDFKYIKKETLHSFKFLSACVKQLGRGSSSCILCQFVDFDHVVLCPVGGSANGDLHTNAVSCRVWGRLFTQSPEALHILRGNHGNEMELDGPIVQFAQIFA